MPRGIKRRQDTQPPKQSNAKSQSLSRSNSASTPKDPPSTPTTKSISSIKDIISPREKVAIEMQKVLNISNTSQKDKTDKMETDEDDNNLLNNFKNLPSGHVMSIGTGITGQLGLGPDINERKKPYPVKDLADKNIKVIAAGGMHSACITENFEIYTFGCNDEGALGRSCADDEEEMVPKTVSLPPESGRPVNITCGDSHCAVLDEFGCVYVWGNFRDGSGVLGLTNAKSKQVCPVKLDLSNSFVVKIASGSDHLALLTKNGVCFTFGSNGVGQLGRGGRYFSDRGGRRGCKYVLQPAPVRFSITRTKISRSQSADDELNNETSLIPSVSSGRTRKSVSIVPKSPRYIVDDIFAAGCSTFIVSQGQVYSFGLNNYRQLGHGDKENRFVPTYSPEYSKHTWSSIVGGEHHCICLTENNIVYGIGRGQDGRLGILDENKKSPEETDKLLKIPVPEPVKDVSSIGSVAYCVTDKGTGYCWGFGENLQLTTGEDDDVLEPIGISGGRIAGKKILSAVVGGQHGLLLISLDEE